MAVHELSIQSLDALDDGRVVAAVKAALKRCALDCEDRPGEKGARLVNLEFSLVPVPDIESGDLESIDVKFKVTDKVPKRQTRDYNMGLRRGGVLVFNDLSDEDINQRTIDQQ